MKKLNVYLKGSNSYYLFKTLEGNKLSIHHSNSCISVTDAPGERVVFIGNDSDFMIISEDLTQR